MQRMSDLPDDIEILKQIVIEQRERLLSSTLQIEQLKLQLAKLRRMQFGRSSEQIDARSRSWNSPWKILRYVRLRPRLQSRLCCRERVKACATSAGEPAA